MDLTIENKDLISETHSKLNLFDDEDEMENLIPKDFIKKKKQIKIWEADRNMLTYLENHYLVFCREDQLSEFLSCFNLYFKSVVYFVTDQHAGKKIALKKREDKI